MGTLLYIKNYTKFLFYFMHTKGWTLWNEVFISCTHLRLGQNLRVDDTTLPSFTTSNKSFVYKWISPVLIAPFFEQHAQVQLFFDFFTSTNQLYSKLKFLWLIILWRNFLAFSVCKKGSSLAGSKKNDSWCYNETCAIISSESSFLHNLFIHRTIWTHVFLSALSFLLQLQYISNPTFNMNVLLCSFNLTWKDELDFFFIFVAMMFLPIQWYLLTIEVTWVVCNDLRRFALIIDKFIAEFLLSGLSGEWRLVESKTKFSSASKVRFTLIKLWALLIWRLSFPSKRSSPDGPDPHDASPKKKNYHDFPNF